jgi:outer membrane cobalamin receptor
MPWTLAALWLLLQPGDVASQSSLLPDAPVGFHEVVVVTATREPQALARSFAFVGVLTRDELERSPALVLDDQLRRLPGFSLFRRSSSLSAHPTTQGVSLRGIGPSGAGRSLVLLDGIPLNDPFGGWVYWNRVATLALEAVEVSRGAASQLYGSTALGGTIQLLSRSPAADTLAARGQLGTRDSYDVDAFASGVRGAWGASLAARAFDTDGFYVVAPDDRGSVDRPARVGFQGLLGRIGYKKLRAGGNLYREQRDNGTQLQTNRSQLAMLHAAFSGAAWNAGAYWQTGRFRNSFSRILPDRSVEFPTAQDDISASGVGGSLTWLARGGLLLGADWRRVAWDERRQNLAGAFAQQSFSPAAGLELLAGARLDVWQNQQAQLSVNPRLGIVYQAAEMLTLRGSAYRGFRAPTLNELYRPFRVGNVVTEANAGLDEEALWGGEASVELHPRRSVSARVNGFWNVLRDPVANVTLSSSPTLVRRQRRNLGSATISGIETELAARLGSRSRLRLSYLFSDARVEDSGRYLPQVPRHMASASLDHSGSIALTLEARFVGAQFEDDQNTLLLDSYPLVDVAVRRALGHSVEAFLSIENLLDRAYPVGRTPVTTLGTPRLVHGGLLVSLSH